MNITRAVSDVKTFRSVVPLRDRKAFTGNFYSLYPVFHRFVNPSDIWRSTCEAFVRLQPMLAPPLTENNLRVRWFYVSLRQVEPDLTPLIITGSNDGKLSEETLPEFPSVWAPYITSTDTNKIVITKNSIGHIFFNIPVGQYSVDDAKVLNQSKASPRLYWLKAFWRIIWDYYRDENLGFYAINGDNGPLFNMADYDSFEEFWTAYIAFGMDNFGNCETILETMVPSCLLKKDYFTSSSPWILKGVQPTIQFQIENPTLQWNTTSTNYVGGTNPKLLGFNYEDFSGQEAEISPQGLRPMQNVMLEHGDKTRADQSVQRFLDNINIQASGEVGFTMADFRDLAAQTKVLERLARTGSRYTEYLRANFNIAPADETLQRAVYLGGFKQNILTNEVLQTAADGDNPVGTMRGHGITFAKNAMSPYLSKEFGMLFALADVRPNLVYTQGISREFTYASRYDFMNPSFQHLSEQAIRKGELYYAADTDVSGKPKNDEVLGFTGMYNEMRTGKEIMCGEFGSGGSMSFWNQAISFASRPSLSIEFLNGQSYNADSQRPFGVNDVESNPIIFDFVFKSTPARQLTKNPVPLP